MNENRRRANLRLDQLRRRLHNTGGRHVHAQRWKALIRADRDPCPFEPLGATSWCIRVNLRNCMGRETEAFIRSDTHRILAAIRRHEEGELCAN